MVAGAALLLGLPGCGSTPPEASSTTSRQHPGPQLAAPRDHDAAGARPDASEPPEFPADTNPQTARKQRRVGPRAHSHVRVAQHPGFDRIVLEFAGTGVPGWSVGYVDEPALEGSGRVVRLDGDAVLNIGAAGTTWPSPGYDIGPRRLGLSEDGGDVTDVYVGGTFEGYTQVLVGIDGEPRPVPRLRAHRPARASSSTSSTPPVDRAAGPTGHSSDRPRRLRNT